MEYGDPEDAMSEFLAQVSGPNEQNENWSIQGGQSNFLSDSDVTKNALLENDNVSNEKMKQAKSEPG